ncbi:MAG: MASE3 domain-containing protein [Desulfobulbaceae bacterium]|jgi:PAS domain S-box-containing protein|nr:MASE3 domain-containing protein [Desulfobulbaceae bacterium]MDY0352047.1 MASE3 domain-containing protein [Desulfobulbaceae bacterium]
MNHNIPLKAGNIVGLVLVLAGLYLTTLYDFLLFHTLAEFFSIVIAFAIFVVAWNTRRIQHNRYFLFLGIAYLFVGLLDLVHTSIYRGMLLFHPDDANSPTQLWIASRYIEGISLLIAPFFFTKQFRPYRVMALYALVSGLIFWAIYAGFFPVCYVEGEGLTPFKKNSEYVIAAILVGALLTLHAKRTRFEPGIFKLLAAAIILTIFSELAFTFYVGVYDLSNVIGHFFKFVSFYLIYKALIETALREPYEFLFKELKESEKKYRTLFSNMLNGFAYNKVLLDGDNRPVDHVFLEVNAAFEKMIGLTGKEIIGRKVSEVFHDILDVDFDFIGEFGKVALTGETLRTEQYLPALQRWLSFSVFSPEKGYFAVVFEDVTDRKTADLSREAHLREIDSLMGELERSNRNLQQFASIVSHDLQEPLRTVSSFVKLLQQRYAGSLDERADAYIRFVTDGTKQMQILLNDLLAYARLGGGKLNRQPLELRAVLERALMNLGETVKSRNATVTSSELPVIEGDETQMVQLFQNLIGNAIKFNVRDNPVVDISAEAGEKEWVIRVRDNGIGIDPKDMDRIFLIFQRLHRREEYQGSGIGLAFCKKIVERHGGRIWVESRPGEGSSFYFSLGVKSLLDSSSPP